MPRTLALPALLVMLIVASTGRATTIAYWKMDESTGSVAEDETGVHDGTAVNSPIVAGPNLPGLGGAANLARQFGVAGPVSHIVVPDHSDWDLGTQFTLEAWIKADSFDKSGFIYHYQPTGNNRSVALGGSTDSGFILSVSDDGDDVGVTQVGIGSILTASEWHWIAATFSSGTVSLYLDGAFLTSGSGPSTSAFGAATDLVLGAAQDDAASFCPELVCRSFDGAMDEVRILDVALTSGEVLDRYESFLIPEPSTALLVGLGLAMLCTRLREARASSSGGAERPGTSLTL